MGRTLHWTILNTKDITEDEKERMFEISVGFNSCKFEDVWTCENFFMDA